jgi:mannose-6-phosphate isomerase-like protein (cupin superfamily)
VDEGLPNGVDRAVPSVEMLPVRLDGRLVGRLSVDTPGQRDEWEMHPDQDEMLYLLDGAITVILRSEPETEGGEEILHLHAGEACIVPQGMWHRQIVVLPGTMLFLTPETLHRPYVPPEGWKVHDED